MKKLALTLGFAAATIATSIAFAGPGGGPGYGPGCADGTAATCQGGKGPGMGGGYGRGQGGGLGLMTPEERVAHRTKMQSLKSLQECNDYLAEHRAAMAERATIKGVTLPEPRANACERMQARGRFG
jgi:hypothetical protein